MLKILSLLGLVFLLSCSSHKGNEREQQQTMWFQNNGKLKVLSTTAIVDAIVKRVGGHFVDTIVLINGELDPHSYQLVKGDNEKLSYADLIFYNGLGLEHGPSLFHYLSNTSTAFSLGAAIAAKNKDSIISIEGQQDPHIWMDPSLFSESISSVVQVLSHNDPSHANDYVENGRQLQNDLKALDAQLKNILNSLSPAQRYLVTSHDAFNYFVRAYFALPEEIASNTWQVRFEAPEGLAPESQLSTINIRETIEHLKKYHIHVVFPESNVSQDSLKKVVDAAKSEDVDVSIAPLPLYGDAMGEKGTEGDSYFKMLIFDALLLKEYLSK